MAFTNQEAVQIRHCLGFPNLFQFMSPALEAAIKKMGEDQGVVARVRTLITSIGEASDGDIGRMRVSELSEIMGVIVAKDIFDRRF